MTIEIRKTLKVAATPVVYDDHLNCFLKLECNNPSGSHKDRETLYLVNRFGWDKQYIVISSGNAGISLAYWMKEKATVLVPETTPKEKIKAIEEYSARVIVEGKYYYDSYRMVDKISKQIGLINVSPGFVDRWRGDMGISYELGKLHPDYVFVPSANHTLAYGVARGFQKTLAESLITEPPIVVSCVVPNHPFVRLVDDIEERFKECFISIYTHGSEGENLERRFLNLKFTRTESTTDLDSVLTIGERYFDYDPAVLLAMHISKRYSGKKVVIVTGIKRSRNLSR